MSNSALCINKFLEHHPITASAPCRIDSGGTWDIKALALPLENIKPLTLNIALNLRTSVTLLPYKPGWVKISSDNFNISEEYQFQEAPFNSQFGIFFAVLSFFNFHGLEVVIKSTSPVKAGLGGSSTATVAAVKVLTIAGKLLGRKTIDEDDILYISYHMEDAINGGMCGFQDQGAAVFGGINKWTWNYSNRETPFFRESILDEDKQRELSKHILVAYSGKTHISHKTNRVWVEKFLAGQTRSGWIEVNNIVNRLANNLKIGEWKEASKDLIKEVAIRREITPEAFTPVIDSLIQESENVGCGARFAGAGGGGSLWALGDIENINKLRSSWAKILQETQKGKILKCSIDPSGVKQIGNSSPLSSPRTQR